MDLMNNNHSPSESVKLNFYSSFNFQMQSAVESALSFSDQFIIH